jgi:hypothetical protein
MIEFILVTLGIVYGLTSSFALTPLRLWLARLSGHSVWFVTLLYCPACTGFWVGVALSSSGLWPVTSHAFTAAWQAGFAGTALGALWSEYGPASVFDIEQPFNPAPAAEDLQ